MKFARIVFSVAGIWGILTLTPLYFMFDVISAKDPPPITHPAFYYGFVGTALAWQIAFLIIATNPVRFRPLMIAGVVEKFTYAAALFVLFGQHRLHASDLTFGAVDFLLAILFSVAYFRTAQRDSESAPS
jgi:hypothetical protein